MSETSRHDSLADQAASWIPPWERAAGGEAADPDAAAAPERAGEPAAVGPAPEAEPAQEVEPAPEAEAETAPPAETPPLEAAHAAEAAPDDVPAEASLAVEAAPDGVPAGEPAPAAEAAPAAEPTPPAEAGSDAEPTAEPARPPEAGPGTGAATPLALVDDGELRGALEAILLVVDEPVPEIVLAQVLEQPAERVAAALDRIAVDYTAAGHGFELRRAAGGWRLYTRPEYAAYVERFVLDGQSVRLTQAALETLAVVAYKQPVTRSRIAAIRGVNSDGVIRTLVSRGLVEECGAEPDSGAFLYRTTPLFLEKLGLDTVDELPPLAPFLPDDVEEISDAPR